MELKSQPKYNARKGRKRALHARISHSSYVATVQDKSQNLFHNALHCYKMHHTVEKVKKNYSRTLMGLS